MEAYQQERFYQKIGHVHFIQDNEVSSRYGVIRGLHFQKGKRAQAKLVRVIQGNIIDIVVDLRPSSATYLQRYRIELSAENKQQLFVPKGFATAMPLFQKAPQYFIRWMRLIPETEEAFLHDPYFSFDWGVPTAQQRINERDLNWPKYVKA